MARRLRIASAIVFLLCCVAVFVAIIAHNNGDEADANSIGPTSDYSMDCSQFPTSDPRYAACEANNQGYDNNVANANAAARSAATDRSVQHGATIAAIVLALLSAVVLALSWPAGRPRCTACRSRVHPAATRCPHCQSEISTPMGTGDHDSVELGPSPAPEA